jgi:transcriptional regulator with XRE-family HTH domain
MKKINELIKSPHFWLEMIQNEIYSQLHEYMKRTGKSQNDIANDLNVSKSYISQVLNGNFNFTLKKLIDLTLYVGKIPDFEFSLPEKYLAKLTDAKKETYKSTINNSCFIYINTLNSKKEYVKPVMKYENTLLPNNAIINDLNDPQNYLTSIN